MATLLKINDKFLNLDHVAFAELKDNRALWVNFVHPKGAPDISLTPDESAALWDYLQKHSEDVMNPEK